MVSRAFSIGWWNGNSFPSWLDEGWGVNSLPAVRPWLGFTCPTLTKPGNWADLGWGMGTGEVSGREMRSVVLVEGVWWSGVHCGEYDRRVNISPVLDPTGDPGGGLQMPHMEQLQRRTFFFLSPLCLSSGNAAAVKLEAVAHV